MLINKIRTSIVSSTPEPQTDIASQPEPRAATSLGIAGGSDAFESTVPNSFDFMTQQPHTAFLNEASTKHALNVPPSLMFTNEIAQQTKEPPDARLKELLNRLDAAVAKRSNVESEIEESMKKSADTQAMIDEVRKSRNSNKPLPDAVVQMLGSVGILGMIGGLPAFPVIGAIAGLIGLNDSYKAKMASIEHELTQRNEQSAAKREELGVEVQQLDTEIRSVEALVEKEKLRLEREAAPFQQNVVNVEREEAFSEIRNPMTSQEETFSPLQTFDIMSKIKIFS